MTGRVGASHHDHDVVVVGSGFGGSVAALRLAEKGYRVLVFEAGRRFADDDSRRRRGTCAGSCGRRALGLLRHPADPPAARRASCSPARAWAAARWSTRTRCTCRRAPFFRDPQWAHDHRLAGRAGAALRPGEADARRGHATRATARRTRVMRDGRRATWAWGTRFRTTPVGVLLRRARRREVDRPVLRRCRPAPHAAAPSAASCMTGCRVGAKNTLVKNYLCARRAARRADRAAAHRRRRRAGRPHRWRGRFGRSGVPRHHPAGPDRSGASRGAPSPPGQRGARGRRVGHPEPAARPASPAPAAAPVRPGRPPDPHQLRGAARRPGAAGPRRRRPVARRGHHVLVPPRRRHARRELSATARARTRWACSPPCSSTAAREGRGG